MCSSHPSATRPPSAPLKPQYASHDGAKELSTREYTPHYQTLSTRLQHAYQLYLYLSSIESKSEGMHELDWSKISSWNSKGTPKLVQQFTSRSAGNTKQVHQIGAGAAWRSSAEYLEEQSSSAVGCDEVQNGSSADQVQSTSAVFKCRFIDKCSDQVQDRSLCAIINSSYESGLIIIQSLVLDCSSMGTLNKSSCLSH
ncbi:Ribonuclease [Dorcoceras hygrometricum]|uniref:Ribonuclease n=1 Tax=Dorcoceras hygrometricum TaxID=472368 RepID=A0A2Z7CRS2_9LAMI|nr:Ribonuclease [Dorcoceras hygrometricum]